MMKKYLKLIYNLLFTIIPSLYYQLYSGVSINYTNKFSGGVKIIKNNFFNRLLLGTKNGKLVIGDNFKCNNKIKSNSIGLIQPCVFNIAAHGSKIIIGNNVGISGSTLCATTSITIGDNVLIGSGCLISDTDSHPINWKDRLINKNEKTKKSPIVIKNNVFIGARCIILKGVTIGEGSVVGAGSVVSKDIPSYSVVCGNPARVVKTLKV
jgi:acetyltransferase-like isoleucine patch superfamily enzyme